MYWILNPYGGCHGRVRPSDPASLLQTAPFQFVGYSELRYSEHGSAGISDKTESIPSGYTPGGLLDHTAALALLYLASTAIPPPAPHSWSWNQRPGHPFQTDLHSWVCLPPGPSTLTSLSLSHVLSNHPHQISSPWKLAGDSVHPSRHGAAGDSPGYCRRGLRMGLASGKLFISPVSPGPLSQPSFPETQQGASIGRPVSLL